MAGGASEEFVLVFSALSLDSLELVLGSSVLGLLQEEALMPIWQP